MEALLLKLPYALHLLPLPLPLVTLLLKLPHALLLPLPLLLVILLLKLPQPQLPLPLPLLLLVALLLELPLLLPHRTSYPAACRLGRPRCRLRRQRRFYRLTPLDEAAVDAWPALRIGLARRIPDGFDKLAVELLLLVAEHPRCPIHHGLRSRIACACARILICPLVPGEEPLQVPHQACRPPSFRTRPLRIARRGMSAGVWGSRARQDPAMAPQRTGRVPAESFCHLYHPCLGKPLPLDTSLPWALAQRVSHVPPPAILAPPHRPTATSNREGGAERGAVGWGVGGAPPPSHEDPRPPPLQACRWARTTYTCSRVGGCQH
mmetsp:Transcript_33900/g.107693  ORF Transcript_33900/g.107693 Transcript_33900/m.107693 type:complete len:321 (-) Transcript_33900:350-1312(-)